MEQQPAYPHKTQSIRLSSHNIQAQKRMQLELDQRGQEGIIHEEKWTGITEKQSKIATASTTNNNHPIETETEAQQPIQEINEDIEKNEERQEYQDNNEQRE
ncbi:hypothetical protein O181_099499 [Austropuccinia psidii MF-1]|uniref:Uncharacterized protein n=1 Tax=Austropuccinia psidii MF-1 TaxID=1389203 RepID=A0A9Q3JCT0_9BASI|nr:hypothetical protein [Austropuccinia psidii MF-1]